MTENIFQIRGVPRPPAFKEKMRQIFFKGVPVKCNIFRNQIPDAEPVGRDRASCGLAQSCRARWESAG